MIISEDIRYSLSKLAHHDVAWVLAAGADAEELWFEGPFQDVFSSFRVIANEIY